MVRMVRIGKDGKVGKDAEKAPPGEGILTAQEGILTGPYRWMQNGKDVGGSPEVLKNYNGNLPGILTRPYRPYRKWPEAWLPGAWCHRPPAGRRQTGLWRLPGHAGRAD